MDDQTPAAGDLGRKEEVSPEELPAPPETGATLHGKGSWRATAGRLAGTIWLLGLILALLAVPGSESWSGAVSHGSLLASERKFLSAISFYSAAAAHPGAEALAHARLGNLLLRRGQWQEAAQALKLAEASGAISRQILLDLATAQERADDLPGSLATLRRLLEFWPADTEAWALLVRKAAEAGQTPSEIRRALGGAPAPRGEGEAAQLVSYLEGTCLLRPDSEAGLSALARAMAGLDPGLSQSAREMREAAERAAGPARSLALANALISEGLIGPAIPHLDVNQSSEAEATRQALLGYMLMRTGKLVEAEEALRGALQIDPDHEIGQLLLGSVLRAKGDVEGAVRLLQRAVDRNPLDPAAHLEIAYAFVDGGDYGSAEQALGRAVEADPDNGDLRLAVANFYVSRQYNIERALPQAEEAVRLLGRTPATLGTLGWGLHLEGRTEAAVPVLEESAAMDPESPQLRYRLGSVYEALGRKADAREQYLMVRELDGSESIWKRAQAALDDL